MLLLLAGGVKVETLNTNFTKTLLRFDFVLLNSSKATKHLCIDLLLFYVYVIVSMHALVSFCGMQVC